MSQLVGFTRYRCDWCERPAAQRVHITTGDHVCGDCFTHGKTAWRAPVIPIRTTSHVLGRFLGALNPFRGGTRQS